MAVIVLIYGGGDLASGVALRLVRAGFQVAMTELPQPLAVRRSVSFSNAVYEGTIEVEGIRAVRVDLIDQVYQRLLAGDIPVIVDPDLEIRHKLNPDVIVDARMTKAAPAYQHPAAPLVIGLGPGFTAGIHCHAVVETMRGHYLGRVYWHGSASPDTGVPESIQNHVVERVLRAPTAGTLRTLADIGDIVQEGQMIAAVQNQPVKAHFSGLLRGLLHNGSLVQKGMKIGDLDPRGDARMVRFVSDKALAVGGGVLEAVMSVPTIRIKLASLL
jgi:xanthine dehydrogenase accessory factor